MFKGMKIMNQHAGSCQYDAQLNQQKETGTIQCYRGSHFNLNTVPYAVIISM